VIVGEYQSDAHDLRFKIFDLRFKI
jgi:hypothetical protein